MIYFITDGTYTKIGKSKNPYKRLKGLQTSNAKTLRCVYIFDIEDYYEKKLHKLFRKYKTNTNSEWFDLRNICIKTQLNYLDKDTFKDKKKAEHDAMLVNKRIYGNVKDFRNLTQTKTQIQNNINNNSKSDIKKLIEDIKLFLKIRKSKLSYKPFIKKYGFTQAEISFYVKSAGLSKQVFNHNNKY